MEVPVTIDNVEEYIRLSIDATIGSGIEKQITAFTTGFSTIIPFGNLRAFTSEELVRLFGRSEEDWSYDSTFGGMLADVIFRHKPY